MRLTYLYALKAEIQAQEEYCDALRHALAVLDQNEERYPAIVHEFNLREQAEALERFRATLTGGLL